MSGADVRRGKLRLWKRWDRQTDERIDTADFTDWRSGLTDLVAWEYRQRRGGLAQPRVHGVNSARHLRVHWTARPRHFTRVVTLQSVFKRNVFPHRRRFWRQHDRLQSDRIFDQRHNFSNEIVLFGGDRIRLWFVKLLLFAYRTSQLFHTVSSSDGLLCSTASGTQTC